VKIVLKAILKMLCASWLCVGLSGCSFQTGDTPLPTATTIRVALAQATTVPTLARTPVPTLDTTGSVRTLQAVPSQVLSENTDEIVLTSTPDAPCPPSGGQPNAEHRVMADVDYQAKTVAVQQQITLINRENESLRDVVLNLEVNRWSEIVTVDAVAAVNLDAENGDVQAAAYELTGRRLLIELTAPVLPGCALQIDLSYRLAIPPVGTGVNAYNGYFGYTVRQTNLGHWLATVGVRRGGTWISHDVIQIGEQVVAEMADWDVSLRVANAPINLTIAAPGVLTREDSDVWRYRLRNSREFAASLSDDFNVTLQQATNGVMVELYSFSEAVNGADGAVIDGAAHALLVASRSLAMYADLFGDYPYERFVIVEGDFADGMEFSGLVFVGRDWFRTYTGDPASYLTIITVHEVAHQWWYASVGNDPALTPWLDEALATYSEYIFFEEYYPALRDWWWRFRVDSFVGTGSVVGQVDSPVYSFVTIRQYINAVYLRGARMMHDLRGVMGSDPFFDWLRRYAEAGKDRVVAPEVIWSLLSQENRDATRAIRQFYLSDANF